MKQLTIEDIKLVLADYVLETHVRGQEVDRLKGLLDTTSQLLSKRSEPVDQSVGDNRKLR